ncbi:MAG: NUDIX domain-containing protein [Bdellovibrionales bacterium]
MSDDKKYEVLYRESLFQGFFRVDRLHIRQELYDGSWSEPFSREVFDGGKNIVVGLLFDPYQDKVVLVEQFRAGPLPHNDDPFLLEVVAGIVEAGEDSQTSICRETFEETSCEALAVQKIFSYYNSPGCSSQHTDLYVIHVRAPEDGTICGLAEEGEYIRVHVIDAMRAINLLYAGQIRNASTLIAMQWFALHHTDLRSRWLVRKTGS